MMSEERRLFMLDGLSAAGREEVKFSFTVHAVRKVPRGVQLHLALKFVYGTNIIPDLFGLEAPTEKFLRKYGQKHHIVPYMIINSVEEVPISWSCELKNGKVTERVETMTTLTYVAYSTYFPFELEVIFLKIVLDGTQKSNLVNLKPASRDSFRYGTLTHSTSEVRIKDKDRDFVCRQFVREEKGNPDIKIATCIYAAFVLELDRWRVAENCIKYVGISSLTLLVTPFLPVLDVGSCIGSGLSVVLAQVGLFYVMPENDDFTSTEQVVVGQLLYVLICTLYWGYVGLEAGMQAQPDTCNAQALSTAEAGTSSVNKLVAAAADPKGPFFCMLVAALFAISLSVIMLARAGQKCLSLRKSIWDSLRNKITPDEDVGIMQDVDTVL